MKFVQKPDVHTKITMREGGNEGSNGERMGGEIEEEKNKQLVYETKYNNNRERKE